MEAPAPAPAHAPAPAPPAGFPVAPRVHHTRIPKEERSEELRYYHANKEIMNVQSYLSKLNRTHREPQYAHFVAYQLSKGPDGKWRMSDEVKRRMRERAESRRQAEEARPAAPNTPPPEAAA